LGPVAFWIVVGTLVIMAAWSITTATYFAFQDDVLARLITRQTEMQLAYEDRIAELRTQVDRITSRQLLDQGQYERKLDQLLRRQAVLESRASALSALPDPNPTGSVKPQHREAAASSATSRQSRLHVPMSPITAGDTASSETVPLIDLRLASIRASLDRVEGSQTATLQALELRYDSKSRQIRAVLAELGLEKLPLPAPARLKATAGLKATGGPFIPVRATADGGSFEQRLQRTIRLHIHVDRLTRALAVVPVRQPVTGRAETTSGFGVRVDPFLRSPAMHTGLDFRGSSGDPVRATASGKVIRAGWIGGYGRMIEIHHSNGLTTRYAHLSSFKVRVGQRVMAGQLIGLIGSTGRSTGPHLHYETRVNSQPVDPQKFLRAGARLGRI
jgi:murein DD-endopeptidase MepM/ murein hydrolase activator NlpD